MVNPTCILDGCDKPSRNKKSPALCKMHYHRQYRHGSVDMVAHESGITASLGRRHTSTYRPGHPLASKQGKVYTHRLVLFEEIGFGPHACHWCGTEIDWLSKGDPRSLQPDHLNGDGADNRLENLVPACASCNTTRGSQARSDALREAGFWSGNDTVAHCESQQRARRIDSAA